MNVRYFFVLLISMLVMTDVLIGMGGSAAAGSGGRAATVSASAVAAAGAAESKSADRLALTDGMILKLMHLIKSARSEDVPLIKELVGLGADDDYCRWANFAKNHPDAPARSPFWYALTLLLTDKTQLWDQRENRRTMLKVFAGVEPDSKKKVTIDGCPLHYLAAVEDKDFATAKSLVALLLDSKICEPMELDHSKKTALFYAATLEMATFFVKECKVYPQRGDEQNKQVVGNWVVINGSRGWIIRELEV